MPNDTVRPNEDEPPLQRVLKHRWEPGLSGIRGTPSQWRRQ